MVGSNMSGSPGGLKSCPGPLGGSPAGCIGPVVGGGVFLFGLTGTFCPITGTVFGCSSNGHSGSLSSLTGVDVVGVSVLLLLAPSGTEAVVLTVIRVLDSVRGGGGGGGDSILDRGFVALAASS